MSKRTEGVSSYRVHEAVVRKSIEESQKKEGT